MQGKTALSHGPPPQWSTAVCTAEGTEATLPLKEIKKKIKKEGGDLLELV